MKLSILLLLFKASKLILGHRLLSLYLEAVFEQITSRRKNKVRYTKSHPEVFIIAKQYLVIMRGRHRHNIYKLIYFCINELKYILNVPFEKV